MSLLLLHWGRITYSLPEQTRNGTLGTEPLKLVLIFPLVVNSMRLTAIGWLHEQKHQCHSSYKPLTIVNNIVYLPIFREERGLFWSIGNKSNDHCSFLLSFLLRVQKNTVWEFFPRISQVLPLNMKKPKSESIVWNLKASFFLSDQMYCVTVISLIMTLINIYREEGKALNTQRWTGWAGTQIYHTLICSLLKKVQNQFFFQVLKK